MQFLRYLGNLLQGDFGPSFKYKDFSVTELIGGGFPVSLMLGGIAILLALVIGITAGTCAALRQNSRIDYATMGFAMIGITIPNFVVAPMLTLFFGLKFGWLPVGGWGSAQHMVLPIIALAPAADRRHRATDARQHDRGACAATTCARRAPRACRSR